MKKIKMFMCVAMAVTLLFHGTSTVYAVTHVDGCRATVQTILCGAWVSNASAGTHTWTDSESGDKIVCTKTREIHLHTIKCANSSCGAIYATNAARACIEIHSCSICHTITGLCQYQENAEKATG